MKKYKKNLSLQNLEIFEICQIVSIVAKCADTWRNAKNIQVFKIIKKEKNMYRDTGKRVVKNVS